MSYGAEQFQLDVYGRLLDEAGLLTVAIGKDQPGFTYDDIIANLSTINQRGGKMGAFILVMMAEEEVPDPELPGPQEKLVISVRVFTDELLNSDPAQGTLLSNSTIRRLVRVALHGWSPNGCNEIYCDAKRAGRQIEGDLIAYESIFEMVNPQPYVARIAAPRMTIAIEATNVITLTHPTEGADIRYTIDGSYPGRDATAYTGPILVDLAEGPMVRAAAYNAASGSDVTQVQLMPFTLLEDSTGERVFDSNNYPIITNP